MLRPSLLVILATWLASCGQAPPPVHAPGPATGLAADLLASSVPTVAPAIVRPHKAGAVKSAAPSGPEEAMRWRMLRWRSADGTIPADGLRDALAQREANVRHFEVTDEAGIAPYGWVERGPDNIGGRTRSLLIDPNDTNHMWAGAVGGGVWKTTDRGQTWTPIDDRMSRLSIGCLTMDPSNSNVIYAGTGEGTYNADAIPGDGIHRSTDRGLTWTRIPSTATFDYTMGIAVSPVNPNLILAATRGGIRRSTDGGQTWNIVEVASNSLQVMFDPNDPNKVIGHAMERGAATWHRVVYSRDAGATWNVAQSGLSRKDGISSRIEVAYAASQPDLLYANSGANNGEIWTSTDGGVNWQLVSSGYGNPFGWYCNTIWVDPTNPQVLVVGSNYVFRSTNGGASLTRIAAGYIDTVEPHPDVHRFIVEPGYDGANNRRLYVVTDGSVYGTDDIYGVTPNSGWYRLDQDYRTTQFYGAAGHAGANLIVGGAQDNGTLGLLSSTSNGAVVTFGGDGGFCAVDAANPAYAYGEYVYLQIHRSRDGGRSANYIYNGIGDAGGNANFIAPFILDPNDQARLLGGGLSLWRTNDARASRPSWSSIKSGVGSNISAIAVAPGNANLLYVGHNDGRVYVSTNGVSTAPTWTAVDDNAGADPFPNRYVGRILVDPTDNNIVYVAFGGFAPDNLWRSIDGGRNWAPAVGSGTTALPAAPVNGIARHPSRAGWLYVATEVGVFATIDGGNRWGANNDGPANTAVDEVSFLHGSETLLAATHGRGLWTIEVADCATYVPTNEPSVGSCNSIPFGAGASGVRFQMVMSRAQLRGRAGPITDLGFAPCATGDRSHAHMKVRMSHVPLGHQLSTSFAANLPNPLTVLDAADWRWQSLANQWSWIGLQRAFVYDGASDVVVDIELIGSQFTGGVADVRRDVGNRLYAVGWVTTPPATGTISVGALKLALSYGCPTITVHGRDCGGLRIAATGQPTLGGSYTVSATGADPSSPVSFNFGLNSLGPIFPFDLVVLGLPGCHLWHDAVVSFTLNSDAVGTASFPIGVPSIPAAQGARLYGMALSPKISAPGGFAVSDFVRIVHGL